MRKPPISKPRLGATDIPSGPRKTLRDAWNRIKRRCYNPKDASFHNYGGRGIDVCQRWRVSFAAFAHDMGARPADKHSIDRIDNNGGYWCGKCDECAALRRPFNCRWATRSEQGFNRRPRSEFTPPQEPTEREARLSERLERLRAKNALRVTSRAVEPRQKQAA